MYQKFGLQMISTLLGCSLKIFKYSIVYQCETRGWFISSMRRNINVFQLVLFDFSRLTLTSFSYACRFLVCMQVVQSREIGKKETEDARKKRGGGRGGGEETGETG